MKPDPKTRSPLELRPGQSSIGAFLKRKDDDQIKGLKSRYQTQSTEKTSLFSRLKSKLFPTLSDLKYDNEKIEKLIEFQRSKGMGKATTLKDRMQQAVNERLYVKHKGRMVYFWQARAFQETIFMHIPRLAFLLFTCYIITKIKINKEMENKNKGYGYTDLILYLGMSEVRGRRTLIGSCHRLTRFWVQMKIPLSLAKRLISIESTTLCLDRQRRNVSLKTNFSSFMKSWKKITNKAKIHLKQIKQ